MPLFTSPIVFINYRRDDSISESGRLNNDLENAFGEGFVFQDLEDIDAGSKWIDRLLKAGKEAQVILAVIGPDWLQIKNGKSRLADPKDWVRKELEMAIKQKKTIIPVLVNDGQLPKKSDIPKSLHALFDHQTFEIRKDKWNNDLSALVKDIGKITGVKTLSQKRIARERLQKAEKEKKTKNKVMLLTIGLILVSALLGYYFFSGGDSRTPHPIVGDVSDTTTTDRTEKVTPVKTFCPDFTTTKRLKTLLYPFARPGGGDHQLEDVVENMLSEICIEKSVKSQVLKPNVAKNEFYNYDEARDKCSTCTSDLFITGLSFKDDEGKFGFRSKIGFCDSKFAGLALDQNSLSIAVSNLSIGALIGSSEVAGSLKYAIEVYLGIYEIKNGNIENGARIIRGAIKKYPKVEAIEKAAKDILWQAEYKLDNKTAAAAILNGMYQVQPANYNLLATKSIIDIEAKQYDEAIKDLNVVIEKQPNKTKKDKYIEKRADVYYQTQQYQKAKTDYQRISTTKVDAKILRTDNKIKANDQQIRTIQAATQLSDVQKANLINLQVQNGKIEAAQSVMKTIDLSKYQTATQLSTLKLAPASIQMIQTAPAVQLTPVVSRNLQIVAKEAKVNNN